MSTRLEKLNRLRVNAGKKPLKSWKASQDALLDAIEDLKNAGFTDSLPGANLEAAPITEDQEIAEALEKPAPEVTKVKPGLGRGLGDEKYAVHSRKAVQDHRRDEKKAAKEEKKLPKGEVDPEKEPEKAARQKKHIEEKKAKRAATGSAPKRKEVGKDEITVADIARELGIDPKIARAKLRRHEDKLTKLHTKGQDRWTFPKTAAKEIKAILK